MTKPIPKPKRAPKVEVSGVSMSVCSYRIVVGDREWTGDTVEGFARDLAASRRPETKP
jgi:hypothetical protein